MGNFELVLCKIILSVECGKWKVELFEFRCFSLISDLLFCLTLLFMCCKMKKTGEVLFVTKEKSVYQMSETFIVGSLLAVAGGYFDAYTYIARGGVFANAQTGNVVLMSQNFMQGNYMQGLHYMCPLLSFALGIFVAERIENRYKNMEKIHWRQIILLIEMLALIIVGFLPAEMNMIANILVSFSCAMQVQTFRKVHGYGYASTMCIGNIRSGTESLSQYLRNKNKDSLYKALHFFGIILIFAIGAGIGGVLSGTLGLKTIWISVAIMLVVTIMMSREE